MTTGTKTGGKINREARLDSLRLMVNFLEDAVEHDLPAVGQRLAGLSAQALDWLERERGIDGENSDFQE
jgi:hypothetical protein